MNERICELVKDFANNIKTNTGYDMTEYDPFLNEAEKFAELIVKECAELSVNSQYANTKSEYYEGFNEALVYAGNKIRKHFGVE